MSTFKQISLQKYLKINQSLNYLDSDNDTIVNYTLKSISEELPDQVVRAIKHAPYIGTLSDVCIFKRKYFLTSNGYFLAEGLTHSDYFITWEGFDEHGWGEGKALVDNQNLFKINLEPVKVIRDLSIWIGGDTILKPNYAHWMFEHLLKLQIAKESNIDMSLPLLISSRIPKSFTYWAELLIGKQLNFIRLDLSEGLTKFSQLYVTSCPAFRRKGDALPALWNEGFKLLRQRFFDLAKVYPCSVSLPQSNLLFLSRDSAAWRKAINEDQLLSIARLFGNFLKINISEYDPISQIQVLSQCKIIILFGGADGFACNFLPCNAKVIEILAPGHGALYTCKMFCAAHSISYTRIIGDKFVGEKKGPHPLDCDFHVDPKNLQNLLSSLS